MGCNKDEMNFFVSGFGPEGWKEWSANREARLFEAISDEEKTLVESFCNDAEGESYGRWCLSP